MDDIQHAHAAHEPDQVPSLPPPPAAPIPTPVEPSPEPVTVVDIHGPRPTTHEDYGPPIPVLALPPAKKTSGRGDGKGKKGGGKVKGKGGGKDKKGGKRTPPPAYQQP